MDEPRAGGASPGPPPASGAEGRGREAEGPPAPSPADPFDAGPYAHLQASLHLPPPVQAGGSGKRALAAAAAAWVPLLVLSALQGLALGSGREAFLLDIKAHARYGVAVPLLVLAEAWCLPQLARIVRQFGRAELVAPEDRARMDALVASARRLLDRRGLEVVLAATAYVVTVVTGSMLYPRGVPSWVAPRGAGTLAGLSLAGWWRVLVSHPLFLLLLAAWLWRLWVWARFLWGVSRLRLRLVVAHPDQMAGLRFLCRSLTAFAPVGGAAGTVIAGDMAREIVSGGQLPQSSAYLTTVGATVLVVVCLFAAPLLPFAIPMRRARLLGTGRYGALALKLGRRFEERWLDQPVPPAALDANDFSATTDLYSVAGNALRMSRVPFGLKDLTPLVLITALPFAPVGLLAVPVHELVRRAAAFFL